ncbi:MAG: DUF4954 family protein [Pirellulales bacterium]
MIRRLPVPEVASNSGPTGPDPQWLGTLDLTDILQLERQGCRAEDWRRVRIDRRTPLARLQDVTFLGDATVGWLDGDVEVLPGVIRPAGIRRATLEDCSVGDRTLIHEVRETLTRCDVGSGVVICDIGSITTDLEATFGNGVEVHILREDGGLIVPIFDELTSNIAALFAMTNERDAVRTRLVQLSHEYAARQRGGRSQVGDQAILRRCGDLRNVRIGMAARLVGVGRVENCTLLSRLDGPVEIGEAATLVDSIVGAGSSITGAAQVTRCFVGQGVRIGDQFSAVDSLFFANSEAFRGEACSALAGPYSVTHHKATLLIAMQTSYFNAGAGTTQCNHAYKTGPVHYGVLERGCKTGGSSSVCWPANIGAFSIVLGAHRGEFDTRDFPFSTILEHQGATRLVPAVNLMRIGPWRDQRKWQSRDRRPAADRRDLLNHDVLSPFTLQRMLRARTLLQQLCASAREEQEWIEFSGVLIKPRDARRGFDLYDRAIRRWLAEDAIRRCEDDSPDADALDASPIASFIDARADDPDDGSLDGWIDLGGCLVRESRVQDLLDELVLGNITQVEQLAAGLRRFAESYDEDCDAWRAAAWRREQAVAAAIEDAEEAADSARESLRAIVRMWKRESEYFLQAALEDGRSDAEVAQSWDADRRTLARLDRSATAAAQAAGVSVLEQLTLEMADIERRTSAMLSKLQVSGPERGFAALSSDERRLARHSHLAEMAVADGAAAG